MNSPDKLRLVIDLKYVNQHLLTQKFICEGLQLVPALFNQGEFFFTADLKSGYHHVDIHNEHWTYLGSEKEVFLLGVLPFGLATASMLYLHEAPSETMAFYGDLPSKVYGKMREKSTDCAV